MTTHYINVLDVWCAHTVPVPGLLATDRRHAEHMFKYFPSRPVLVLGPAAGWSLQTLQYDGSHFL